MFVYFWLFLECVKQKTKKKQSSAVRIEDYIVSPKDTGYSFFKTTVGLVPLFTTCVYDCMKKWSHFYHLKFKLKHRDNNSILLD